MSMDTSKGRGKGRGRGRGGERHDTRLSRGLSRVLRHSAIEDGLEMTKEGYVKVDDLLAMQRFSQYTFADLQQVVTSNDKQRFKLEQREDGIWMIRANQGHSIDGILDASAMMQPIQSSDELPICIHGTYSKSWDSIRENGLSKMKRNHIHFACGLPGEGGVISGMRSSAQVLIYLDVQKALADGIQLFRSDNNVILSPGLGDTGAIPAKYFSKVIQVKTNQDLLQSSQAND